MYICLENYIIRLENQVRSIFNLAMELESIKSIPKENNKGGLFLYESQRKFKLGSGQSYHNSKVENLMQIIIDQSTYFDDLSVLYEFNLVTSYFDFFKDLNTYEKNYFNGFLSIKMKSLEGYINEIDSKKFYENIPENYHILGKRIIIRNFVWVCYCYMFLSIELSKIKPDKKLESYDWNIKYKDKLTIFFNNFQPYFKKDLKLKDFKDCFNSKPISQIKPIQINIDLFSGIDLVYLLQTLMEKQYIPRERNTSWQRFNAIFKDFQGNDINTNSLKAQKSNLENDYSAKSIQKVENIIP
jgi:hypothetical protein